ncbi:hypothetical protein CLV85_0425 [Salinibacterium amurskyense]|uniref:Tetratricopeptide repeat protein n=1 Tax=Salinibacterium amurskyense TaxID=205941 RepID=A0A2M9D6C1_9MICO|nr:hypothetical protein [Salinibacterium amurskyense]PJJ81254.1 hypothetical protein CLV85_0425 [Salinibacterium amurskyense]RLQ83272.1 hypothetical protein D9C83_02110 [Salinibacterium amurskyense]GHD81145.1 hypothetical protein GCM10007394_13840 [Salinibacterium amurskyense]
MVFALSDIDAPTEGEQWLLRAEELFTGEEFAPALSAGNQAVLLTSGVARVNALEVVTACCVQLGQFETADIVAQQRHDLLIELDRPLEAASQAKMGLARFGRAEPYDLAALEREARAAADLPPRLHAIALLAHADAMWRQSFRDLENIHSSAGLAYLQADVAEDKGSTQFRALRYLVQIAYDAGDAPRMLEFCDLLLASARNRTARAEAHTFHALALSGVHQPTEALHAVNLAIDLYAAIDLPERLYNTTLLGGRLAVDARERAVALGRFRDAVTLADQLDIDNSEARKAVANTLVATDNHTEAIGMLTEVYNHETATGAPPEVRAESLDFMAHSLAATEQPDAAIEVWAMASNLYTEARALDDLARANYNAAALQTQRDNHEAARELLMVAAAAVRESEGDGALYVGVLHSLGMTQARVGDRTALATFDEIATETSRNNAMRLWATALDGKARALHILGETPDAIEHAAKAAAALRSAGDPREALTIERFAAELLAEQGRTKDAIKLLKTVVKNARGDAEMLAGANRELADCYDALGKKRRATGTRSLAEKAQP